jgi:hypothetical protein
MAERNNPAAPPQHPLAVTRTELVCERRYGSAGTDILGNDTTKMVKVKVK